jgi:arginyl-tRNA synthetase
MLRLGLLPDAVAKAYAERAPNHLCDYSFQLATVFSTFYHHHHILREPDRARQASWLALTELTERVLKTASVATSVTLW